MKKLLFFFCLVQSLAATAQSNDTTKYTPVGGYGYMYKRLKVDSSLMLAMGDTTNKALRQIKFVGNNIFYSDNAGIWHALATGSSGGGQGISSIYNRGDSLFYTLNGAEYFVYAYFTRDSADARYYSITNPAGYLTSAVIAGKVNYTDTALMRNPYLHKGDTALMLNPYLHKADTTAMLSPYLHKADTALMLSPYLHKADTTAMLNPYLHKADTALMLTPYLHKADTAAMLNPYLHKGDTASMLNPYMHKADTAAMLSPYLTTAAGNTRYPLLSGSYSNPTWVNSLAWGKLTGTPTTLGGYGITDAYSNTNPAGYITSTALAGYVPAATTLSINGTAYDLSANRSWSVPGLPSQTGNGGRYLTTDGSNASWANVSASGATPHYYGSIYNKNSWTDLSDFVLNNITATVSSNKIVLTAASGGISSLDYNYYSQIEHWNNTAKFKVTNTSASVAVGIRGGTTSMAYASINLATGVLIIANTNAAGNAVSVLTSSVSNLTINANDYILLSLERVVDTLYATARDITTGSAFVTASVGYKTDYSNGFTPFTGRYCALALSGTSLLDSMSVTSNEIVNSNLLTISDSKGSYTSDSFKVRWTQQISNYYYPIVVSVGPGEGVDQVLLRMPEIIALNPKIVLLLIGRNNYASAMQSDTLHNRYSRIVSQLSAAGITVYHLNGVYETSSNLAPFASWINSSFLGYVIDTYDPTSQIPGMVNTADNIHLTQAANDVVAKVIIQSGLIKNGINYKDIVRFNTPPIPVYNPPVASGTQSGIVTYDGGNYNTNQQLGNGMKTVVELKTLSNIMMPPTGSGFAPDQIGGIGVIYMGTGTNPPPFLWQPNSNLFLGTGAGNCCATGTHNIVFSPGLSGGGAGNGLSSGSDNIIAGYGAMQAEDVGSGNVAIGNSAGYRQEGGSNNVYIGTGAASNSYIASSALASYNVIVGWAAGSHYTLNGSYNTFLGNNVGQDPGTTPNHKLAIGGGTSGSMGIYGDIDNGNYIIGNIGPSAPVLTGGVALQVKGGAFMQERYSGTSGVTAVDGSMYYDTTLHKPRYYNGSTWTSNTIGHSIFTPTNGVTITVKNNSNSIINPSGSLAALTISLSSALDGDMVYLTFKQAVSTIIYSSTSGSVVNAPTSVAQGQQILLTFDSASGNWY